VSARQQAYLKAMGIDVWVPRLQEDVEESPPVEAAMVQPEPVARQPDSPKVDQASDIDQMDWSALRARVSTCSLCELQQGRTQTVFGVGNQQADLLVIGEAPGAEEDRQGEPFVGRAGQLLTAMLKAIHLSRQEVYIANILKCRPPDNRDPRPEEAALCSQYLKRQIELIQPRLILAVGRIAAQRLLQTDQSLSKMRGQLHEYSLTSIPLIVTYHPAYLLRTPLDKRKAWQDLLFAQNTLGNLSEAG